MREIPINGRINGGVAEMIDKNFLINAHMTNQFTCGTFIILMSSRLMFECILQIHDKVKNHRLYRGALKMRTEELVKYVNNKDNLTIRYINDELDPGYSEGLDNMYKMISDSVLPTFNHLIDEIYKVINDEHHIKDADFISMLMVMDCATMIAEQTINDLCHMIPGLRTKTHLLSSSTANKMSSRMVHEIQPLIPKKEHIELEKELVVMSDIRKILKKLRDAELFANAFREGGFVLENENVESLPSGPNK